MQRAECEQRQRNAEHERVGRGEDQPGPDDGKGADRPFALLSPLVADEHREGGDRDRDDEHREQLDAEDSGERVVEDAVRDEAVAAGVPEVVPENEPVLEKQSPLVDVRSQVGARRTEPDEEGGQQGGPRGGEEQVRAVPEPDRGSHQRILPVWPIE